MKPELVIFDMDGTIIDSESLAERVVAAATHSLPRPLSAEEVGNLFRGRTLTFMLEELALDHGGPLPENFLPELDVAYRNACVTDLRATSGVEEAIKAILPTPICVASNGEPGSIQHSLSCVGLLPYFGDSLFSARHVAAPKPAPDVFLHAAEQLGAPPGACVVIEDSPLGVEGALAAGMKAIGFAGNHPEMEVVLAKLGVPVITDMRKLPRAIEELR